MLDDLKERVTHLLAHVTIGGVPDQAGMQPPPPTMFENHPEPRQLVGADAGAGVSVAPVRPAAIVQPYRPEEIDPARPETWGTTPRNAACPCGSGKKYKYCHGKV
jgi:preprotein translocase subunit SecA